MRSTDLAKKFLASGRWYDEFIYSEHFCVHAEIASSIFYRKQIRLVHEWSDPESVDDGEFGQLSGGVFNGA